MKKLRMIFAAAVALTLGVCAALSVRADGTALTATLRDGYVHRGSRLSFEVTARDGSGAKIPCSAALNGEPIAPIRDDGEKTAYTLIFTREGENIVTVAAGDGAARREHTYHITYQKAEEGEVIGSAVWSVEAFTCGAGYVVYPIEAPIREGENAARELLDLLRKNGLICYYGGAVDGDFYLAYIADGDASPAKYNGYTKSEATQKPAKLGITPSIPDAIIPRLKSESTYFDADDYAKNSAGFLGEFVFTNGSGWMHSVNGAFPNTALSDLYLSDGDVVRIQYTLAYGADITGDTARDIPSGSSRPVGFFDTANKDALTRVIAISRTSEAKRADNVKTARREAMDAAAKLDATQEEVDRAEAALAAALADPVYETGSWNAGQSDKTDGIDRQNDETDAVADPPETAKDTSGVETHTEPASNTAAQTAATEEPETAAPTAQDATVAREETAESDMTAKNEDKTEKNTPETERVIAVGTTSDVDDGEAGAPIICGVSAALLAAAFVWRTVKSKGGDRK